MALPALALLKGTVAKTASLLAKKKAASAMKKSASAIVKRDPNQGAVEKSNIKVKTKVVSVASLLNVKSLKPLNKEQSKKSSGVDSIDSALDRIDSTLAGLISTVEDRSNLQRNSLRKKNIRNRAAKKSAREDELESKKPHKFGMKVPRPFKGAFGAVQTFFNNIIIGGLVLLILNNMDKIVDTIKGVYNTMKDVVTKVGNFLQPVWKALKWIWPGNSPSGVSMVRGILANKNTQDLMDRNKIDKIADEYDRINERTKTIKKLFGDIGGVNLPKDLSKDEPQQYDISTLVPLLKSQGATDDEAVRLAAIGMHESSGDPNARNTTYPDNSYGLFQVNMLDEPGYMLGEERRNKYGITNEDLLNPEINAAVALDIMRTQGRSAWSTDDMVTPEQLEKARESLKPPVIKIGDQSKGITLPSNVASLKTIPSYATPSGGNTVVLMEGNQQSSVQSSGGGSGPLLMVGPSKKEVLNSFYDTRFKNSLYKVG